MSSYNRRPKSVKKRSNNRRQEDQNTEEANLNGSKSLSKSIDNIFFEKSFDASMFSAKSNSNLNASTNELAYDPPAERRSSYFIQPENLNSNSIYDVYKSISNAESSPRETVTAISKEGGIELSDIYSMEGKTVDLELFNDHIKWKHINTIGRHSRMHNSQIPLSKVFSIQPKIIQNARSRKNSMKPDTQPTEASDKNEMYDTNGIVIHTFVKEKPNNYATKSISFEHPHRLTCNNWIQMIREKINVRKVKKEVLVLLNPHSGEKKSRSVFNHQILPILRLADISYSLLEFHNSLPLRDLYVENNFHYKRFYGIIIIGGDGSVSNVINLLIELEANKEENMYVSDISQLSKKMRIPLCVIPVGSTNQIANSIYGTTNLVTPLMYLIYGIKKKVDICSAFINKNKLHSFGFSYTCGFGTTLARYMVRYAKLGNTKSQTSLAKGASKHRHRVVEIEIEYLLNENSDPKFQELCFKNCKTCSETVKSKKSKSNQENFNEIIDTIDEIRKSTTKQQKADSKKETWLNLRGSFIYVAFLSNSAKWSNIAPGGLSKYAHLGDGYFDIILVEPTNRKDFYRFLKRHANNKNQLDFPFVKSLRVKEAHIKILNATYLPENDLSDSESMFFNKQINDESKEDYYDRLHSNNLVGNDNLAIQTYDSDENVEDYETRPDGNNYENYLKIFNTVKKSESVSVNKLFNDNTASGMKPVNKFSLLKSQERSQKENFLTKKSKSIMNLFKITSKQDGPKERKKSDAFNTTNSFDADGGEFYDKSFISKGSKKDNELKMPNIWNCDWNLDSITEMSLKCNRQFLTFFADGIDPDTQYENSSISCLPGL